MGARASLKPAPWTLRIVPLELVKLNVGVPVNVNPVELSARIIVGLVAAPVITTLPVVPNAIVLVFVLLLAK